MYICIRSDLRWCLTTFDFGALSDTLDLNHIFDHRDSSDEVFFVSVAAFRDGGVISWFEDSMIKRVDHPEFQFGNFRFMGTLNGDIDRILKVVFLVTFRIEDSLLILIENGINCRVWRVFL